MTLTRAAILAGLIGLALVFAAREQIWVILAGPADQGAVDFANITRSGKPNDFLMCPKDLCADADAQTDRGISLRADELRASLHASLQNEPHLTRMDETTSAERYVQKTALMRFPDTISVRFIALSATTSTIAIYSRSRLGYSDLGVNKARVERWVAALSEQNP